MKPSSSGSPLGQEGCAEGRYNLKERIRSVVSTSNQDESPPSLVDLTASATSTTDMLDLRPSLVLDATASTST